MNPQADCEYCKLVYGFEEPRTESLFGTEHFLAFWKNTEQKEILIVDKRHGWVMHTLLKPTTEKERGLQKAVLRARAMLLTKTNPEFIISSYRNVSGRKHFHVIISTNNGESIPLKLNLKD